MSLPANFQLDFTELSKGAATHRGFPFQSLVGEILEGLGFRVERGGTGPDHGRDLFFWVINEHPYLRTKYEHKWLVSCKDNSKAGTSIKRGDFPTLYNDAMNAHCDGALIASTTQPTDDLVDQIQGFATNKNPLKLTIWDGAEIRRILHENESKFRLMLIRYFPESYGAKESLSDKVLNVTLDLIAKIPTEQDRVNYALQLNPSLEDPLSTYRLVQVMIESVPDFEHLVPLMLQWKDNPNADFQKSLEKVMCDFTDKHEFDTINERCADRLKDKYSHVRDVDLTYLNVYNFSMDNDGEELTIMTDFEFEASVHSGSNHKTCSGTGEYVFCVGANGKECLSFSATSHAAEEIDDED